MGSRIALYWHNGRSLGHTAESALLAHALARVLPDTTIAGITGAAKGLDMFPDAMDIIKLPSFRNFDTKTKTLLQPVLSITEQELFHMRQELIRTFLENFSPQLFVVNHLPVGANDELIPAIANTPATKKLLTLRGILFTPEKTNAEYFNPTMSSWIDKHFSEIHIHTDPAIFRLEDHYTVPDCLTQKFVYTGYMKDAIHFDKKAIRQGLGLDENKKIIVASMGGGQGTHAIWLDILDALDKLQHCYDLAYLITGPYIENDAYMDLERRVAKKENYKITQYESNILTWMMASDLFIGAGGANMIGEILATRTNSIVIPRQLREAEQEMHTELLAQKGLIRKMNLNQMRNGETIKIAESAIYDPIKVKHGILMNGAERSVEYIKNILDK